MGNTQAKIRFIETACHTLFTIDDGGEIEISLHDGSVVRMVCRHIDEHHLRVGKDIYHIYQFAGLMERAGQTYRPVTK